MSQLAANTLQLDEHVPDSFIKEFWNHFKQNKGAVVGLGLIIAFVVIAIFAPLLAPYDPTLLQDNALRLPPIWAEGGTWSYPLGTDDVGRDILSRLIHGARISMGIGFAVVILSLSMGL